MRVVVLTIYDNQYRGIADVTTPIMNEYADRHGYYFEYINKGVGFKYFEKIRIIKSLFENVNTDVVFYIDVDALITNLTYKVEYFLEKGKDIYVCKDVHELNFGVAIIRNSEESLLILERFLLLSKDYENEQNILNKFQYDRFISSALKVLPHPSINSYDYSQYPEYPNIREREQGHHHEGDFVLHVPALSLEKRLEVLSQAKIIR